MGGLIAIAKNCPTLETLSLEWCWLITDVGLACVVNKCKNLINLNLCGVLRLSGDFLLDINKLLVGLQLLDLEQCPGVELSVLSLFEGDSCFCQLFGVDVERQGVSCLVGGNHKIADLFLGGLVRSAHDL